MLYNIWQKRKSIQLRAWVLVSLESAETVGIIVENINSILEVGNSNLSFIPITLSAAQIELLILQST